MEQRIIYYLDKTDVQTVAMDLLDRELSENEIDAIEDLIAEKINWYDAIESVIMEKICNPKILNKYI